MSNWTEEQQEQYEQGNDGGYTPPKGSLDWAEQPAQPEPAPKGTEAWTEQNSGGNAPEPSESKEPPKTDVAPPADKPAGVSPHNDTMGYDQQIAALQEAANRVKPETEEERKKRERREKSAKIVSAVSDGLQALSNLFFTTRGAPNMYDHKEASQLTPLQEKLEKLKAERQANADKYLQYSLKIGDAQNERAKTLREMEAQQERAKLAREKAQREQEEHGWLAALQPDKQREQAGKATKPSRRLLQPRRKRTMLLTSTRQRLIPKRHEVRHRERRLHQAGQRPQTIMLRRERTTAPTTTSSVHGTRMDANTSSERQQLRRHLPSNTVRLKKLMLPLQVRLTARQTASPPLPTRRKVAMPSA